MKISEPMKYGLRMLRRPLYASLDKDGAISLRYLVCDLYVTLRTLKALQKRGLIETLGRDVSILGTRSGRAASIVELAADLFARIRLTPEGQRLADEALEEHRQRRMKP